MPHTSRSNKKKNAPIQKRKEVLDEDGWTRITSSPSPSSPHPHTAPRRTITTASPQSELTTSAAAADGPRIVFTWGIHDDEDETRLVTKKIYGSPSRPMSPAKGTTPEKMEAQYKKIAARFVETDYHAALRDVLARIIVAKTAKPSSSVAAGLAENRIETCVLFGSGSLCGDGIHWIDRHETAYYQVAAFKMAVDIITESQGGHRPQCYAQEPDYNWADTAMLETLGIKVVTHPKGFEALHPEMAKANGKGNANKSSTFAYSPAAELEVEYQIMYYDPHIWLHRSLDHLLRESRLLSVGSGNFTKDEAEINMCMTEKFKQHRNYTKLPDVDLKNFPFHGSVLWWRKEVDVEQEESEPEPEPESEPEP